MISHYNFINVGAWNIHVLYCNINKTKINKLDDPEFKKRLKSFEILCLQETQCGPNDTMSLSVNGYRVFSSHRKISQNGRHFGGSLLLVKNELKHGIRITDNLNGDKIWIKLKKDFFNFEKDIFICFAYIPPLSSTYTRKLEYDIFQKIEDEKSKFPNEGNIILAGDFNAKTNVENDFVIDFEDDHSPVNDSAAYDFDMPLERKNRDKHAVVLIISHDTHFHSESLRAL